MTQTDFEMLYHFLSDITSQLKMQNKQLKEIEILLRCLTDTQNAIGGVSKR